jgi:N-acyl homoserine lactone hydrolase
MKEWAQYFDDPVDMKLYVMSTGSVHMSGNIHFNKKSPEFKSMPKDERFNPVLAYMVEHPEKGPVMLDTGVHACFSESPYGNFGPLLGRIVKIKAEKGGDAVSQLASIGVSPADISCVILSHLHLDHTSSLPAFKGAEIYADAAELKAAGSPMAMMDGCVKAHREGVDIKSFDYGGAVQPFDRVCDFFGDGSLFVIGAEGHTKGNVAVLLNAKGGPILLTFDAAHRAANVKTMIPPKGDYEQARRSLGRIKAFVEDFPQTRVIFGHDPDQLGELQFLPSFYT